MGCSKNLRVEALYSLMESVRYGHNFEELWKNVGQTLTDVNLEFLYAIRSGHLHHVEELHKAGHGFQAYKELSVRLAIQHENLDVLRFLVEHQYMNRDLSSLVGELARPYVFDQLLGLYRSSCHHNDLVAFYRELRVVDPEKVLEHTVVKCTVGENGNLFVFQKGNPELRHYILKQNRAARVIQSAARRKASATS